MSNAKRKSTYFSLPIRDKKTKISTTTLKTPYQRHLEILEYLPKPIVAKQQPSEIDILKNNHLFLREDEASGWEERLAQKYYDQLFKEYCLSNLSRYKTGQIALRWRTRDEVLTGKGQFTCGNLECKNVEDLASFELNFGYVEQGIKKNALVKLRLCSDCGYKLNYKRKHSKQRKDDVVQDKVLKDEDVKEEDILNQTSLPEEVDAREEKVEAHFWSQNAKKDDVELSKEEEFDQYFADLLQ